MSLILYMADFKNREVRWDDSRRPKRVLRIDFLLEREADWLPSSVSVPVSLSLLDDPPRGRCFNHASVAEHLVCCFSSPMAERASEIKL